jgi:hypothetical protein
VWSPCFLSIINSRSFGSNNESQTVALSALQSQLISDESIAQFKSRRRLSGNGRVDATSLGTWHMNPILASNLILVFGICGVVILLLAQAAPLFIPNYAGTPRSDGSSGAWLASLITGLRKEKKSSLASRRW